MADNSTSASESLTAVTAVSSPPEYRPLDPTDCPIVVRPADGAPFGSEREKLLCRRIENFFTRNLLLSRVIPVVSHRHVYVPRDIVWAVTNYFREYHVTVTVPGEPYPVHLANMYDTWRDHYSKEDFDTYFRAKKNGDARLMRITAPLDPGFVFDTSVGQCLFFEFACRYGVLEYMESHHETIRAHHKQRLQEREEEKRQAQTAGLPYKRRPLCDPLPPRFEMYPDKVTLKY